MKHWGKHLVMDLKGCVPHLIRCPFRITDFSKTLVQRIDMKPYGQPWIQHFGSGNKAGYTLVQLIETSNITAHFAEEDNSAYIDVFSCKDFDQYDVEGVVYEFFNPERIHSRILDRGLLR
jgi:hypothetical protein